MTHSKQNGATITLKKSATLPSAEPLSSIMTTNYMTKNK